MRLNTTRWLFTCRLLPFRNVELWSNESWNRVSFLQRKRFLWFCFSKGSIKKLGYFLVITENKKCPSNMRMNDEILKLSKQSLFAEFFHFFRKSSCLMKNEEFQRHTLFQKQKRDPYPPLQDVQISTQTPFKLSQFEVNVIIWFMGGFKLDHLILSSNETPNRWTEVLLQHTILNSSIHQTHIMTRIPPGRVASG